MIEMGLKMVEGVEFCLCGHALRHFEHVFGNCYVILCRLVHQAICAIIDCFLLMQLFNGWIRSSFTSSLWRQRLSLSASMLLEWEREIEQDDLEVGVFYLPSAWRDNDDESRCFLSLARNFAELLRCFWYSLSCRLQLERLGLDSSSEVVPAEADGDR